DQSWQRSRTQFGADERGSGQIWDLTATLAKTAQTYSSSSLHRIRTSRCALGISAVTILFARPTRGAPLFPPLAKNHAQLLAPALVNSHQLAFDFGGQVAQQSVGGRMHLERRRHQQQQGLLRR